MVRLIVCLRCRRALALPPQAARSAVCCPHCRATQVLAPAAGVGADGRQVARLIDWPIVAASAAGLLVFLLGATAVVAWASGPRATPAAPVAAVVPAATAAEVQRPRPAEPVAAVPVPPARPPEQPPVREEPRLPIVTVSLPPASAPVQPPQRRPDRAPGGDRVPPPAEDRHGTRVDFVCDPVEAADLAARNKKLLFLMHLSGNFENRGFT